MIEQIANKISDNNEEKEIVYFGLKRLKVILIAGILVIITGMLLQEINQTILYIACLLPLRQNAGGYHMQKIWKCSIFSYIILVLMIFYLKYIELNVGVSAILLICSILIISLLSPVCNKNHYLDNMEKKVYGWRARLVCYIEGLIFIIFICFKKNWYKIVLMAEVTTAVLLIIGKIQEKIIERKAINDL